MKTLRLFVSSPGDVESERLRTKRLIERLAHDYSHWAELLPYFWEHEPHDPSTDFTTSIGSTADYDIVVVILWSRLGNRLHSVHRRADGAVYRSGTEYEVLTALEARERSPERLPRLAVFLNQTEVSVPLSLQKETREAIQRQYDALQTFLSEHFQERESDPDLGDVLTNKRAYTAYRTLDEFEELLEKALRGAIEGVLGIGDGRPSRTGLMMRPEPTWEGNPYRALQVFEAEHAPIYFGRTRAIGQVVDRLRTCMGTGRAFLLLFGASGSGKSSLLRAGVVPLATSPGVIPGVGLWRQAILKPSEGGSDPFLALAAALLRGGALPELAGTDSGGPGAGDADGARRDLARQLRQGPAAAAARIEATLAGTARVERERQAAELRRLADEFGRSGRGEDAAAAAERAAALSVPRAGLFLAVDQMEELFTGAVTEESRRAFLDTVQSLAASPVVLVLATLRSDFYPECESHAGLMALKEGPGSYHLEPPTRAELERMIREPARSAGVVFEEHPERGRLDASLLEAAEQDPDALPLLEFCLSRLFEVGHADGVLTYAAYEGIGELAGVLSQRAEEVFAALAPHEQGSLEEVIRALATLSGEESQRPASQRSSGGDGSDTGVGGVEAPAVVRRVVPVAVFDRLPGARGLVDRFVAERLLTGGLDAQGVPVVAVTHEALLKQWKRVSAWLGLDENRRFLAVRARVAQRLRQWEESGRDASFLLHAGRELEEAEREFADYPLAFAEGEKGLLLASRAQVRQQERRRAAIRRAVMAALSGLTLAALGAAGWATLKQREAEVERQRTQFQLERSQLEEGRAWLERAKLAWEGEKNPLKALMFAGRAVGFHGYGRRADESLEFSERYPSLLGAPMSDPENEASRRVEENAVRGLVDGILPTGLPIWSSPSRLHHSKAVASVSFSPDGIRIASGAYDKTVKVWDAATGQLLATCEGHSDIVTSVAFSPDGSKIVSGSSDKTVKLWDAASGRELATLQGHSASVSCVAFSPDGRRIASGAEMGSNSVILWDWVTGELEMTTTVDSIVTGIVFSPDGNGVIFEADDPLLWNTLTGVVTTIGNPNSTSKEIAISPDGSQIALGTTNDKAVILVDVETREEIATLDGHSDWISSVQFNSAGHRIASASGKTVTVWDAERAKVETILEGPSRVTDVAFSPDGNRIASGWLNGTVILWDVTPNQESITFLKASGAITCALFSPSGDLIASCENNDTVRLWDSATRREVGSLNGHSDAISSVAFSPDGSRIATGSDDNTLKVWDVASGRELATLNGHSEGVNSVAFSPDGNRLASGGGDNTIKLWATVSGKVLATLGGHSRQIFSVAFSPDGRRIASGSGDDTVKVWDASSGRELATLHGHSGPVLSVAFSPDGRRIASGSWDQTVKMWDAVTGEDLATFEGHSWYVVCVVFSPDGRQIASASGDKSVRFWDVEQGKALGLREGHSSWVYSVAFSPEGSQIISGSLDGTVKQWDTPTGIGKVCASGIPISTDKEPGNYEETIRAQTTKGNGLFPMSNSRILNLREFGEVGYFQLEGREVVWTANDTRMETRTPPASHERNILLAQLASTDLTPARRLALRVQLCARGNAWRPLPALWTEAQAAGLDTDPEVRRVFLRHFAIAARSLGVGEKAEFPNELWSRVAVPLQAANFSDPAFSLPLAQGLPPFLRADAADETLVAALTGQVIANAPPSWLEAVARQLSEAGENESAAVTARRQAFLSEVRGKYPDLAPKPKPNPDPTGSDR